ncbi:MAG TPA: CapA family protein [Candidatus Udaeobacter sp.]|nr:CapA family protein [Candidatus Udaeobacter sp.]
MHKRIIWPTLFFLSLAAAITLNYFPVTKKKSVKNQLQTVENFSDFISEKKKLPQTTGEVSLIAVGDIMLSRTVASKIKYRNDINYPFLKISNFLKEADITFGNLENPITSGPIIMPYEMTLRANPGVENALKNSGFDIVSLANNHTPNFGEQGIIDTISYLDSAGILHIGAGQNSIEANQPVYITRQGITFAFLAYNDTDVVPPYYEAAKNRAGTAFMRSEKMVEAIKQAKQKADFVIISMHAGKEYTTKPNKSQTNFAHKAIDAGAELIIGHHPHVIQSIEKYKGKYILYSLGNFVFDQTQPAETKQGLAVKIFFDKTGVSLILPFPISIEDLSQPKLLENNEAAKIIEKINFPFTDSLIFEWNKKADQFDKTVKKLTTSTSSNKDNLPKLEKGDIDNDGKLEELTLQDGKLKISQEGKTIWESSNGWWVDDFSVADSNNDGIIDINLAVWKSGNFGNSKPFWIKENDPSIKNHFFVFDIMSGIMKPIWQSSNLAAPNCEFKIADIDGDNKQDLVVLEGDYSQKSSCSGNYVAVWKWNGWGFSNEWRSDEGNFRNLRIENTNNKQDIIVDKY